MVFGITACTAWPRWRSCSSLYAFAVLGGQAGQLGARRVRRHRRRADPAGAHRHRGRSAVVGVGSVWALRIGQSLLATRRLPVVPPVWRRTFLATGDRARRDGRLGRR